MALDKQPKNYCKSIKNYRHIKIFSLLDENICPLPGFKTLANSVSFKLFQQKFYSGTTYK